MVEEGAVHAIELTVNGEPVERVVPARQLLVHFLRDSLGKTGTHIGCDTGNCGACTVIVDGQPIKSCMMLAVQADGAAVETVESLAPRGGELNALQRCFSRHHALQCGYCTPGFLMAATTLLDEPAKVAEMSDEELRRNFKGNICRCTGYVNIIAAIRDAATEAQA